MEKPSWVKIGETLYRSTSLGGEWVEKENKKPKHSLTLKDNYTFSSWFWYQAR